MKKTGFVLVGMAMALVFGLVLSACGDGAGSGGGGGSVTVTNFPSDEKGYIYVYPDTGDGTITTRKEYAAATGFDTRVATTEGSSLSPFPLYTPDWDQRWKDTGTYLVVLEYINYIMFKTGVAFSKGSATIDLNDMTNWSTLPNN
ncbi:hypothetical protein [Treponema primitia]|uniref:hypothetical protein n=1 Tax=Treponema primitia TaxID=88058 RepID=UPI00025554F2|nr:hypothetical protein [Treponema primitia]